MRTEPVKDAGLGGVEVPDLFRAS